MQDLLTISQQQIQIKNNNEYTQLCDIYGYTYTIVLHFISYRKSRISIHRSQIYTHKHDECVYCGALKIKCSVKYG